MKVATERSPGARRRRAITAGVFVIACFVLVYLRYGRSDDDNTAFDDLSIDVPTATSNPNRGEARRPQVSIAAVASPERATVLSLIAVDDRTSAPVADALAYITPWRTSGLQPAGTRIAARSDARGLLTLERGTLDLAWSRGESLTVWKEGYLPRAVESAPAASPAEVRLLPAESLRCRIVDPEDRPISGAVATVATESVWGAVAADFDAADFRLPGASPGPLVRVAKSDRDGLATIHGLEPGSYRCEAFHPAHVIELTLTGSERNRVEVPHGELKIRMLPVWAAVALPHRASARFINVARDRLVQESDPLAALVRMPIQQRLTARSGEGAVACVVALDAGLKEGESAGDAVFTWIGADGKVRITNVPLVPIEAVVPLVLGEDIDSVGGVVAFEPTAPDGKPIVGARVRLRVSTDDVLWRGGPLVVDSTARVELPTGRYRVSIADPLIEDVFDTETFVVSTGDLTKVSLAAKIRLRQLSLTVEDDLVGGLRPMRSALKLVVTDATTRRSPSIDCPFGERTTFHLAVGFRGSLKYGLTDRLRWNESLVVEDGDGPIDLTPALRRARLDGPGNASRNSPQQSPRDR